MEDLFFGNIVDLKGGVMEMAFPALILFLAVLVRLYLLSIRRPTQPQNNSVRCRLHRWKKQNGVYVCRLCGYEAEG